MKALILAGGRGKRLNEFSANNNKCMIVYEGKPIIEYSLDAVANISAIESVVIVVGYRAEDIINYYGNSFKGKRIQYAIQTEQRGLVHAIETAKEQIGDSDLLLMLGDEHMKNPHQKEMIERFQQDLSIFGICGVLTVADRAEISKTYSVLKLEDERIVRLIEKPQNPINNIKGTGNCVFRNKIYDYIPYCPIHHQRNEKELPDLIQTAIGDGQKILAFTICDEYRNINTIEK